MKYINIVLFFSAIFFFHSQVICQQNNRTKDTLKYRTNPNYNLQLEMFDLYKTKQADIVLFGNSLTHGAEWTMLLGRSNVVKMGIPSDVLRGYLARIDYVIKLNPKIVFIMGGLNDVYNWTPLEEIFQLYLRLINELRAKNIIPVIQSATYSAKNYAKEWGGTPELNNGRNREIDKLNKMLSDYSKKNNLDYIDIISQLSTRDGFLRSELTWDGIHLKAEAYKIWAHEIEKVLQKYKL